MLIYYYHHYYYKYFYQYYCYYNFYCYKHWFHYFTANSIVAITVGLIWSSSYGWAPQRLIGTETIFNFPPLFIFSLRQCHHIFFTCDKYIDVWKVWRRTTLDEHPASDLTHPLHTEMSKTITPNFVHNDLQHGLSTIIFDKEKHQTISLIFD